MSIKSTYEVEVEESARTREYSDEEKIKLRPICEIFAMLDGNAFFNNDGHWWHYLPEAWSLYESNGGDDGWAGQAEFAKLALALEKDPELKELYNQFKFLATLKGVEL